VTIIGALLSIVFTPLNCQYVGGFILLLRPLPTYEQLVAAVLAASNDTVFLSLVDILGYNQLWSNNPKLCQTTMLGGSVMSVIIPATRVFQEQYLVVMVRGGAYALFVVYHIVVK
jgi:hypothetical protein